MKHAKAKKRHNKTYVICGHHFGYNGEFYYVEGRYIKESFTHKATAVKSYVELEVKAARSFDLSEVESLVGGDMDLLEKLDDFVYQRSGVSICEDYTINWGTHLPKQLSNADVLRFVNMAKMQSYRLLTFEKEPVFYALWIPEEDNYHFSFNEGMDSLVFSESKQQLANELECLVGCHDWRGDHVVGDLATISHSPSRLKQLIHQDSRISYNAKSKELRVTGYELAPYKAVNKLLIRPLFEIRALSLDDLRTIERQISDNFMEEYGYQQHDKSNLLSTDEKSEQHNTSHVNNDDVNDVNDVYPKNADNISRYQADNTIDATKNVERTQNKHHHDHVACNNNDEDRDRYASPYGDNTLLLSSQHADGLALVCESILHQTHAQARDYLFAFGPICRHLVELNDYFQTGFDIHLSHADVFRDFYTNHRIEIEDGRFHRFYCDYYYEIIDAIYKEQDFNTIIKYFDEAFHFSCVLMGIFQDKEAAAIVRTEFETKDGFEEWRDYVLFLIRLAQRY